MISNQPPLKLKTIIPNRTDVSIRQLLLLTSVMLVSSMVLAAVLTYYAVR